MTDNKLDLAVEEAQRFISKACVLKALRTSQIGDQWSSMNPRESGSVRRASMDLTRALADLRRVGR